MTPTPTNTWPATACSGSSLVYNTRAKKYARPAREDDREFR